MTTLWWSSRLAAMLAERGRRRERRNSIRADLADARRRGVVLRNAAKLRRLSS